MTSPEQFKLFLNNLNANVNKTVNPDGEKRGGYALFLFDIENPDGNIIILSNVESDEALDIIAPEIQDRLAKLEYERKKNLKEELKKERKKHLRRII